MKKERKVIIKGITIGVIIGGIVFGGIGVTAVTLQANQIKYTPSNSEFNATNAEEALNEIYKIAEYEIPADTYFYNSETSGDGIVRYKKVDGKYYLCDENGKIINNEEQDVTSITLVEYTSVNKSNLNIGTAAYANDSFILGELLKTKNTVHDIKQNQHGTWTYDVTGKDCMYIIVYCHTTFNGTSLSYSGDAYLSTETIMSKTVHAVTNQYNKVNAIYKVNLNGKTNLSITSNSNLSGLVEWSYTIIY